MGLAGKEQRGRSFRFPFVKGRQHFFKDVGFLCCGPDYYRTTPMFCIKYKVRRNDTSLKSDLGSILPPKQGGVGYAVLCLPRPDGSPLFIRERISRRIRHMSIWTILFVILLIAWLGGFTVFHVAGGLIHLLLVFAVISLILHFVLGTRAA